MSDRTLRLTAGLVALAGIGIATYLTWVHYDESALVCVAGRGCETVQRSSYAEIVGIPIALPGVISYAAILVLILWDAPYARLGAAMLALVGLAFSAYLVVVQLFVIDATCVWCLANDVLIAPALALLTALRLRT